MEPALRKFEPRIDVRKCVRSPEVVKSDFLQCIIVDVFNQLQIGRGWMPEQDRGRICVVRIGPAPAPNSEFARFPYSRIA